MAVEEVGEAAGDVAEVVRTDADVEAGDADAEVGAFAAAVVRYPIAPGYRVNVRSGPGTHYSVVRTLPYNTKVPVYCQKPGTTVNGPYGTSSLWDNIANGEFVSDAYVKTGSDGYVAPRCA